MPLRLEIVSEHRGIVGDDAVREFGEGGGSIGRSLHNDWILPDPDRYISGRHAIIDYKGGMYYLADLSTNGVYINDEHEPLGGGNPRRLFDGDRLRFGDFEIAVSIDEGETLAVPQDDTPTVLPGEIEERVPEDVPASGKHMLDEEEITGDDAFSSTLLDPQPDSQIEAPIESRIEAPIEAPIESRIEPPTESSIESPIKSQIEPPTDPQLEATTTARSIDSIGSPRRAAQPAAESQAVQAAKRETTKPVMQSKRVEITADDLLDTFLDGLGISRADLHPSVDPAEVMQNAGEVMKEFVAGMAQLLVSRAHLKSAFRLDQTAVLPRYNNPLKLSQNPADSIKQLLVGREGEYLGPRDSVREVCRDLLFHQDAFLNAMGAAFAQFADRFDPEELEAGFATRIGSRKSLSFLSKYKYWQLYCELYPALTETGGGRFPQVFSEEFVKCYERQVAEFIRANPSDHPQPKSVPARLPVTSKRSDSATVDDERPAFLRAAKSRASR